MAVSANFLAVPVLVVPGGTRLSSALTRLQLFAALLLFRSEIARGKLLDHHLHRESAHTILVSSKVR